MPIGKIRSISWKAKQGRLFSNIAEAMEGVPEDIIQRQLQHFYRADPAYSNGVAKALGLEVKLDAAE